MHLALYDVGQVHFYLRARWPTTHTKGLNMLIVIAGVTSDGRIITDTLDAQPLALAFVEFGRKYQDWQFIDVKWGWADTYLMRDRVRDGLTESMLSKHRTLIVEHMGVTQ